MTVAGHPRAFVAALQRAAMRASRALRVVRVAAAAGVGVGAVAAWPSLTRRPCACVAGSAAGSASGSTAAGSAGAAAGAAASGAAPSAAEVVERVAAAARLRGYDIAVGLTLQDYNRMLEQDGHDRLALPTFGRTSTLAILLGSTKTIWTPFLAALRAAVP